MTAQGHSDSACRGRVEELGSACSGLHQGLAPRRGATTTVNLSGPMRLAATETMANGNTASH